MCLTIAASSVGSDSVSKRWKYFQWQFLTFKMTLNCWGPYVWVFSWMLDDVGHVKTQETIHRNCDFFKIVHEIWENKEARSLLLDVGENIIFCFLFLTLSCTAATKKMAHIGSACWKEKPWNKKAEFEFIPVWNWIVSFVSKRNQLGLKLVLLMPLYRQSSYTSSIMNGWLELNLWQAAQWVLTSVSAKETMYNVSYKQSACSAPLAV